MRQTLAVTILLGIIVGAVFFFVGWRSLFATPDAGVQIETAMPAAADRAIVAGQAHGPAATTSDTLDAMRLLAEGAGRLDLGKGPAVRPGFDIASSAGKSGVPASAAEPFSAGGSASIRTGGDMSAALAGLSSASSRTAGPLPSGGSAGRSPAAASATTIERFAAAASGGDIRAAYRLGLAYRDGKGVTRDAATALQWLLTAAKGGNSQAEIAVAEMYDRGSGVARDPGAAWMWFDRAGTGSDAAFLRDYAVKERDRVASTMSPAELAAAREKSRQ